MLHARVTARMANEAMGDLMNQVGHVISEINHDLKDTKPWVFLILAVLAFGLFLLVSAGAKVVIG